MINKEYTLNTEQVILCEKVKDLIKKGRGMLCVNAPAGTGKTYTIGYLRSIYPDIQLLAPTHKACSLYDPKYGVQTIHKFLKAEKEIDPDSGDVSFLFGSITKSKTENKPESKTENKPEDETEKLIIVDECSMVSESMFEAFEILSKSIPILFCGDQKQIPPVGESLSMVFRLDNTFTLTKNMRSRDSISNKLLQKFRKAVDSKTIIKVKDKVEEEFILNSFLKKEDSVILAWTNKRVNYWNNKIRSFIFKDRPGLTLEKYYEGEQLIFSGYRRVEYKKHFTHFSDINSILEDDTCFSYYIDKYSQDVVYYYSYYSNSNIRIESVKTVKLDVPYLRCSHQKETSKRISKCDDCMLKGHNSLKRSVIFYVLTDELGTEWLSPIDDKNEKIVDNIRLEFLRHCKKMKDRETWIEYYEFTNKYLPNINYSYASTVHKSQGSQYKTVFVDLNNIRVCKDLSLSLRLTYTAISRMIDVFYFT